MANARCPGCGMMAADPLGHLAHGMAQATPEPTFAGKSLDQVVKEAMREPDLEQEAEGVEEVGAPAPKIARARFTKVKGSRPRKA